MPDKGWPKGVCGVSHGSSTSGGLVVFDERVRGAE